MRMSKSSTKLDLKPISNVLRMTKMFTSETIKYIARRLLIRFHIYIDHHFLNNFSKRCQFYHVTDSVISDSNTTEAQRLAITSKISHDELKALDGPEVVDNIHLIYVPIMQNGSSSWKTLEF